MRLPLRFCVNVFVVYAPPHHHLRPEVRDRICDRRFVVDRSGRSTDRLRALVRHVFAHRDEGLIEEDPQEDEEDSANLKIYFVLLGGIPGLMVMGGRLIYRRSWVRIPAQHRILDEHFLRRK